MNPKPLSSLNHLTVPVAILLSPPGYVHCETRRVPRGNNCGNASTALVEPMPDPWHKPSVCRRGIAWRRPQRDVSSAGSALFCPCSRLCPHLHPPCIAPRANLLKRPQRLPQLPLILPASYRAATPAARRRTEPSLDTRALRRGPTRRPPRSRSGRRPSLSRWGTRSPHPNLFVFRRARSARPVNGLRMLGTTTVSLLEREAELRRIEAVVEAASAGQGGLVLVEGAPGIGKTRLLDAARASARTRGAVVLSARASELDSEFPFGAVRQLFEPEVAGARPQEPGSDRRLIDALATDTAALVLRPAPLSERAVAELVAATLGDTPDARFSDACQHATGGNPFLLRELLRELAAEGVSPSAE